MFIQPSIHKSRRAHHGPRSRRLLAAAADRMGSTRSVFTESTISSGTTIKEFRARLNDFIQEREKRHFPDVHNKKGTQPKIHPTGRVYIPHGHSKEQKWSPHPHYQNPRYSEHGLDWKSNVKWRPDPRPDVGLPDSYPVKWYNKRSFPDKMRPSEQEWTFYDGGYKVGKRCYFSGQHRASSTSQQELTHSMLFGKGRFEFSISKRNGLPQASDGDKSYQVVEYSPEFHQQGSTRPLPNFGGGNIKKADTFVPLQELPPISDNYSVKEKQRLLNEEVDCVRGLEQWRASPPLKASTSKEGNLGN